MARRDGTTMLALEQADRVMARAELARLDDDHQEDAWSDAAEAWDDSPCRTKLPMRVAVGGCAARQKEAHGSTRRRPASGHGDGATARRRAVARGDAGAIDPRAVCRRRPADGGRRDGRRSSLLPSGDRTEEESCAGSRPAPPTARSRRHYSSARAPQVLARVEHPAQARCLESRPGRSRRAPFADRIGSSVTPPPLYLK